MIVIKYRCPRMTVATLLVFTQYLQPILPGSSTVRRAAAARLAHRRVSTDLRRHHKPQPAPHSAPASTLPRSTGQGGRQWPARGRTHHPQGSIRGVPPLRHPVGEQGHPRPLTNRCCIIQRPLFVKLFKKEGTKERKEFISALLQDNLCAAATPSA